MAGAQEVTLQPGDQLPDQSSGSPILCECMDLSIEPVAGLVAHLDVAIIILVLLHLRSGLWHTIAIANDLTVDHLGHGPRVTVVLVPADVQAVDEARLQQHPLQVHHCGEDELERDREIFGSAPGCCVLGGLHQLRIGLDCVIPAHRAHQGQGAHGILESPENLVRVAAVEEPLHAQQR